MECTKAETSEDLSNREENKEKLEKVTLIHLKEDLGTGGQISDMQVVALTPHIQQ